MSLYSMTGHGRGTAASDLARVEVDLSTVNRKQLDINLMMPRFLAPLESRIHGVVQENLSRGRVTGEISIRWHARARMSLVRVDEDLAAGYLRELRRVAEKLDLRAEFSGRLLLDLPEVVEVEESAREAEKLWPLVEQALRKALQALLKMRRAEGATLARDLVRRFAGLKQQLLKIRARAPGVARRYAQQLTDRLAQAGFQVQAANERVAREIALFADRADITEETVRLASHLDQARKLFRQGGVVGRSLDFLAQEIGREINTIGSKANDGEIAHVVVEFKAELERIREQVQNIE